MTRIHLTIIDTTGTASEATIDTPLEDSDLQVELADFYEELDEATTKGHFSEWHADTTPEGLRLVLHGANPATSRTQLLATRQKLSLITTGKRAQ